MPWLSGNSSEWIMLPIGDIAVEVKRVTMLMLDKDKLVSPDEGYDRDRDGWPPKTVQASQDELAIGWRISFGMYGSDEEEWVAQSDDEEANVSWTSPFPILSPPCAYTKEGLKFYKPWERYVGPVLGGMGTQDGADTIAKNYVREMGVEPGPVLYKEILEGMRCKITVKKTMSKDGEREYRNIVMAGSDPKIFSDPDQVTHNQMLLRKVLVGEAPEMPISDETMREVSAVYKKLLEHGTKNQESFEADISFVGGRVTSHLDEITQEAGLRLLEAYTDLLADLPEERMATAQQIAELTALFTSATNSNSGYMTVDQGVEKVKEVMGPNADARRDAAGGKYMAALTYQEAIDLTAELEPPSDMPF